MLTSKETSKVIFLDIETTTQHEKLSDMPTGKRSLFLKKFEKDIKAKATEIAEQDLLQGTPTGRKAEEEIYDQKGPLFAEFNKIICISAGAITTHGKDKNQLSEYNLHLRSFCNDDEKQLLQDFISPAPVGLRPVADFAAAPEKDRFAFCAHNGKIFDFPVIGKRLLINNLPLHPICDYGEKKPWDVNWIIDTKDIWKWGVFDGATSLDLLAATFNIESSKSLMSGDQVKHTYWDHKNQYKTVNTGLQIIQDYCELDVLTLARLYLKLKGNHTPLNIKK